MPTLAAPKKKPSHKWQFLARFRAGAYQWRASALACKRVREAVKEIRDVAARDPELGAEGAVRFMERVSPAIEGVDGSSGAMGSAVWTAIEQLADVVAAACAGPGHAERLERLFQAMQEDDIPYLEGLGDEWGRVCGTPEMAARWADQIAPTLRRVWGAPGYNFFKGATAALSSLLAAGRYQELLDTLSVERRQPPMWAYRRFGVEALQRMGRLEEALAMAGLMTCVDSEATVGPVCEELMIALGREEEAYRRYGLTLQRANNYKLSFKATCKRYPQRKPGAILHDLIEATPGREGQWFAAAMDARLPEVAMECARRGPCNPETMLRACPKLDAPTAHELNLLAVRGYLVGWKYEVAYIELLEAVNQALERAGALGPEQQRATLVTLREWSGGAGDSTLRRWLTDILNRSSVGP